MSDQTRRPRSLAAGVLDRTLAARTPVDRLLRRMEADLDPRDRRLVHELVLGSLRWLRRLDAVIEQASARPLTDIDAELLAPLRLGVYQLLFLQRIPAHAAVDEAVREARRRTHRGGAGFTNAVLRRVARAPELDRWPVELADPLARLALETSHPEWLVERWWGQLGESETRRLLAANNRPKPRQMLVLDGPTGRESAAERLAAEGVRTRPSQVSPMGLVTLAGDPLSSSSFADGSLYLQDGASQAAALVPPPAAGERVLDLAAAPGGKSFSLLAWERRLAVVAVERDGRRIGVLAANRRRLGVPLALLRADARRLPLTGGFDRVVLDAPCSGTGTLRKNPELKWRLSPGEIARLAGESLTMMESGADQVRPGGLLCLVTCSIEPEENAGVVRRFLARHSRFEPLVLTGRLPEPLASFASDDGGWQMLPGGAHDGFTVHVLRRTR